MWKWTQNDPEFLSHALMTPPLDDPFGVQKIQSGGTKGGHTVLILEKIIIRKAKSLSLD